MTKLNQKDRWAALGQLLTVFATDRRYGQLSAESLVPVVLPALDAGQYAIAREKRPIATGEMIDTPVAAILFARVSLAIDAKLRAADKIPQLPMHEWSSGPLTWIMHSPGEQMAVGKLLDQVHQKQLGGTGFAAYIARADGTVYVKDFEARRRA